MAYPPVTTTSSVAYVTQSSKKHGPRAESLASQPAMKSRVSVSSMVPAGSELMLASGGLAGLGPGEKVSVRDDGIGFLQRGQLEPGRSLMEQAVDPHGLLNAGKKT